MKKVEYPENLDKWVVHFVRGKLTEEERIFLQEWRNSSAGNEALFSRLVSEKNYRQEVAKLASWDSGNAWKKVRREVVRKSVLRRLSRVGVAAAAVLALGLGGWLWWNSAPQPVEVAQTRISQPGIRLSRSSGQVFRLDTLQKLTLNNTVIEGDGQKMVVKARSRNQQDTPEMNMIEVPAEAEYSLILADGTRVLLNASTIFRFPDDFSGQPVREVYLNGEAYFEVVSDSVHPFIVHTGEAYVRVLGTSFNVMAYAGSEMQQTTLIEGRVCMGEKVNGKKVDLWPGMQASYHKTSGELEKKEVDVSYYTAWKDGLFAFREQRLEEVMEILSRWYGFEYFFQNSTARDYIYTGKVSRHKELKEVLEYFRLTEELEFNVSGNTVIIRTKN